MADYKILEDIRQRHALIFWRRLREQQEKGINYYAPEFAYFVVKAAEDAGILELSQEAEELNPGLSTKICGEVQDMLAKASEVPGN